MRLDLVLSTFELYLAVNESPIREMSQSRWVPVTVKDKGAAG